MRRGKKHSRRNEEARSERELVKTHTLLGRFFSRQFPDIRDDFLGGGVLEVNVVVEVVEEEVKWGLTEVVVEEVKWGLTEVVEEEVEGMVEG